MLASGDVGLVRLGNDVLCMHDPAADFGVTSECLGRNVHFLQQSAIVTAARIHPATVHQCQGYGSQGQPRGTGHMGLEGHVIPQDVLQRNRTVLVDFIGG